jgi:hypothetical protein
LVKVENTPCFRTNTYFKAAIFFRRHIKWKVGPYFGADQTAEVTERKKGHRRAVEKVAAAADQTQKRNCICRGQFDRAAFEEMSWTNGRKNNAICCKVYSLFLSFFLSLSLPTLSLFLFLVP